MNEHDPQKLSVIARAPFMLYFEGDADVITAKNRIGEFDVLPSHADFFSMLTPCEVIIENGDHSTSFPISNGIITVRNNIVMLFVNM